MLTVTLYYLPCLVCLMWTIIILLKKRNRSQNYILAVLGIGFIYYIAFAVYISPSTDYLMMVKLDALCQFMTPLWMVFHMLYVESHLKVPFFNDVMRHCLYIPAFIHGGIMAVVYYMISFDNAAKFLYMYDKATAAKQSFFDNIPEGFTDGIYKLYHFTAIKQFHIICVALCACTFLIGCLVMKRQGYRPSSIIRFLAGQGSLTPGTATSVILMFIILLQCPLMLIGRSFVMNTPVLGLTMSILEALLIFFLGYVEYMSHVKSFTLRNLANGDFFPGSTVEKSIEECVKEELAPENPININDDEAEQMIILNARIHNLMERVQKAFEEEKVYKNPDLTLQMLADKLNTNRTTLSNVLKYQYKMTFKEYLAHCRIEKAKEYMLQNPEEVMESIADRCGFGGGSNFSHKFKDEVGVSPKAWLQSQLDEKRKSLQDGQSVNC